MSTCHVLSRKGKFNPKLFLPKIPSKTANTEIEATLRYRALRLGTYYPGCASSAVGTLGNPTYIGEAPYVGPPPTSASRLDLLPSSSQLTLDKVRMSPESPPERPTSYPLGKYQISFIISMLFRLLYFMVADENLNIRWDWILNRIVSDNNGGRYIRRLKSELVSKDLTEFVTDCNQQHCACVQSNILSRPRLARPTGTKNDAFENLPS